MKYQQWSPTVRYFVFGVMIILILLGLWFIRSVLNPLIVAAFVAYLLGPAVHYLTRRTKISHRASVNIVFYVSLLVVIGTPASLTSIFFSEFERIIGDILNLFDQLILYFAEPHRLLGFNIDLVQAATRLELVRSTLFLNFPENVLPLLEQTSMGALWILVIFVAVYYLLSEWTRLRQRAIASFPVEYAEELEELYQRIRTVWMNYLRGQLLLMLIVAVVFSIAWAILGIPGALVLGILAGFFTIIPDVGPFLAAVMAAAVALLEGSNWIPLPNYAIMLIVIAVYLVLIGLKNFWLRPYVMGRSVHMPEPLVFVFIIMATVMWGILGALLVIPASMSLFIIFDYLRRRVLGMSPFPDPTDQVEEPVAPPPVIRRFQRRGTK